MNINKKQLFNIPNILCYFRLLLIPVFIYSFIKAETTSEYYISAAIILLSGLTDFADGFIARKFNMVTELGKALDPIADKLNQAAIIFCLMIKIKYMYLLVLLFVVKELVMGIYCLVLLRRGKKLDGAKWFGKISTAVFYTTTFILIAIPSLSDNVKYTLMIITGFFLSLSFILYIREFIKLGREKRISKNNI